MLRKVCLLLMNEEGTHDVAFMWETKKAGNGHEVVSYLVNKFRDLSDCPAGYTGRSIATGDRITVSPAEGPAKGRIFTYELATHDSYKLI